MSNSTLTFRDYPYIPNFWYDQGGRLRWTLTVTQSAVLSAFLAIIVTYGLGRIIGIVFGAVYVSLYRRIQTIVSDQVATIATNVEDPLKLFFYLSRFAFSVKRRALTSTFFRIIFPLSVFYIAIQQASIFFLAHLIITGPVPISPGACGIPIFGNTSNNTLQSSDNLGDFVGHRTTLVDRAAVRFDLCSDDGTRITCPGPAGQTFAWDVVESDPGHCWFGPDHCLNNSRTISQRATFVPSDMGTIRRSPLSLTVMLECSHVNNTPFVQVQFDSQVNLSFYAYQYGTINTDFPMYPNDPFYVYFPERFDYAYRFGHQVFNLDPDPLNWTAPAFLTDNLNNPFLTDNTTAPSTVYLLFNRIWSIASYFRNDDPFYLTVPDPDPSISDLYASGRIVSTMACRDRYEVNLKPQGGSQRSTWSAVGTFKYVFEMLKAYKPEESVSEDMLLFVLAMSPSAFQNVIQGLSGNFLNAQKTLLDSTQYGHSQNVSTRVEVTRWFGTAVQYTLSMAGIYTSGTDNDWELGISKLPDQYWFCDKTLRVDPRFVSVYVRDLLLIVFSPAIVELISRLVDFLIMRSYNKNPESPTAQRVGQANIVKNLHTFLHLHRLWLEASSRLQFRRTWEEIPIFEGLDHERVPNYLAAAVGTEQNTPNENEMSLLSDADVLNPTGTEGERRDNYQAAIPTLMEVRTGTEGERWDNEQRDQAAQCGKSQHRTNTV